MADDNEDWSALVAAQENEVDVKVITSLFCLFLSFLSCLENCCKRKKQTNKKRTKEMRVS